jgi:hypothetical protein
MLAVLLAGRAASAESSADEREGVAAAADVTPPVRAIGPWILARDSVRFDATAELEASNDRVAKPFALAPDLWWGATDDLTIAVTESKYATTGFRGAAGGALCLSGESQGCPGMYNNAGIEAWFAVARQGASLVVGGGPYAVNLDRGFYAGKLGFKSRVQAGAFALAVMPSVFVAATGRDAMPPANRDMLYVPVALSARAGHATLSLGSGVKGPLATLGREWVVPVGASATYSIGAVTVGGSFVFGSLISGLDNPRRPQPAIEGTDVRVVQLWVSYASSGPKKRRPAAIVAAAPSPPPARVAKRALKQRSASHERSPSAKRAARERVDSKPAPSAVAPAARAERISDETISAIAADHGEQLTACSHPNELSGEVSIAFEIDAKGAVAKTVMSSTVHNMATSDCVLGAVRGWKFPEPASGTASGVYTLTYRGSATP